MAEENGNKRVPGLGEEAMGTGPLADNLKEAEKSLEKKVYFAGEATIKSYYGTCHGAYISGVNAANEIISDLSD